MSVFVCPADGPPIASERDAVELVGAAWAERATVVAIPAARLGADFFDLRTRVAGELIQKLVNYHLRLAVVGDVSAWAARSEALRDFIYEANRGTTAWFVADLDELAQRLAADRGT